MAAMLRLDDVLYKAMSDTIATFTEDGPERSVFLDPPLSIVTV
jgi:hypothetical protein